MQKNFSRVALLLALLLVPFASAAMGVIHVDDIVAGFDTQATLSGLPTSSSVDLHIVSPSGEDTAIPLMAHTDGTVVTTIPARLTQDAGVYRAFGVHGQTIVTNEATFEILSDRIHPDTSSITVDTPLLTANGSAAAIVTVTLRDAHGNPLIGRPVQLVGSRVQDRISPLTALRETDAQGREQFAVQTQTPGEITLRAMDVLSATMLQSSVHILAQENSWGVGGTQDNAGYTSGESTNPFRGQLTDGGTSAGTSLLDHFEVSVSTDTVKVRDVIPQVTIKAVDRLGQVIDSFTGTVDITTPNDPNAVLPGLLDASAQQGGKGQVTFAGKNRGVVTIPWSISFRKPGEQILHVADRSGTVTGQTTVTVTGTAVIASDKKIQILNPKEGTVINARSIEIEGKGPALRNLKVWMVGGEATDMMTSGAPSATGDTDEKGQFRIPVTLPNAPTVAIEIQDEAAEYDSGIVRVQLDPHAPTLTQTFDPPKPTEGQDVTLTVQSEQGLPSMTLRMQDQEFTLTSDDAGMYHVLFQAPAQGNVDYTIHAVDSAGNVTDVPGILEIAGPLLPQVRNVKAESLAGGVQLTWDLIPDDTITSYRIDVGRSAAKVDFTLNTPGPIDGAAVMGLTAGIDYAFVVRALRGDQIGIPSEPVITRTLGMELTATGQEGGLLLQWTFPDATPLSSFILEYGVEEGTYTEKRMLDGAMRAFTLKDLLPTPYYLRLTPIATTGVTMTELATMATGMPLAGGFHASAGDDIFNAPSTKPLSNDLHSGAPTTPGSGLPNIPLWMIFGPTSIIAYAYWSRRRKQLKQTQAFLSAMHQRYRQR